MWRFYFLLTALSVRVGPAGGFSNGKVYPACADMAPQHGYEPQPGPPPYVVTVDRPTFGPGDNITVSLRVASSSAASFRGFLIEARDAGKLDASAGGVFHPTDPRHSQGSGVSHTSSSEKTRVDALWQAPDNPPQKVQFLVTVVRAYKVYWARIPGPAVSLGGATGAPVTAPSAPTTSTTDLTSAFSSAGCGDTKSCLRDPVGCRPESDPHCFFLSFSADGAGQSAAFELSGPARGYVSFALSLDTWMGNDDVYLCVSDGGGVAISPAHASGRKHPEPAREDALWGKAWRVADGVIQCRFHRNIILPDRFNLNQSYFLFLAHGASDQGLIHRHSRQPLISSRRTVVTGPAEDLSGSRSPLLIKFHGALMLGVWLWMASAAVFVARHYKRAWPDAALLGQRPWFQVHRTVMVLAVVLTAVAFSLPFMYRRGWSKRAGSHPFIGCAVMTLCVIQPIMAVLRPSPESPRRTVFNWLHFGAGTAAQILAVVCMFLGAAQQALLLPSPWCPAVLTGWVLWVALPDALLLIHSCRLRNREPESDDKEQILSASSERRRHGEVWQVKKLMLVVFIAGNTAFLAAFIKAIGDL